MVIRCPTVANSFSFLILRDFCRIRCPHSCKQFSIADFKRFLQTFTVYLFSTSPMTKFHPSWWPYGNELATGWGDSRTRSQGYGTKAWWATTRLIGFIWLPTFKVRQPWKRQKMEKKKFKDWNPLHWNGGTLVERFTYVTEMSEKYIFYLSKERNLAI
jgi:hypothetical protein